MARGGKREGAGRKPGALTTRTREVAERAIATGKSPLDVMLENMRHFQQVALDAEAILDGLSVEEYSGEKMTPEEQFKKLLAEVKKAAGFRQMAHECARDAAQFVHPRLAATALTVQPLSFNDMSDEEVMDALATIRAMTGSAGKTNGRSHNGNGTVQ